MLYIGRKQSEESKQKLRIALKGNHNSNGKYMSVIVRQKISNTLLGHNVSILTRQKIGLAIKGKHLSEETKQKLRMAFTGCKCSDETKQKISKKLKAKSLSIEHLNKIKEANLKNVPHHIDCDHNNDDPQNKIEVTRREHGIAHTSLNKLVKSLLARNIIKFSKELKVYELI